MGAFGKLPRLILSVVRDQTRSDECVPDDKVPDVLAEIVWPFTDYCCESTLVSMPAGRCQRSMTVLPGEERNISIVQGYLILNSHLWAGLCSAILFDMAHLDLS